MNYGASKMQPAHEEDESFDESVPINIKTAVGKGNLKKGEKLRTPSKTKI